jgi:hypothetical protein
MLDGFYVGYMTGVGYGVVLFAFKDDFIIGVDAGGVRFDGKYSKAADLQSYVGKITVTAPANINLVQGVNTGASGLTYEVEFSMPEDFLSRPYISVSTPIGPVNVKLEKLRDLGNAL